MRIIIAPHFAHGALFDDLAVLMLTEGAGEEADGLGQMWFHRAPGVMETAQLDYLREHLLILSGFYGLLRPFDGVTPYRLDNKTHTTR